jgi:heme exporter protein A
MQLSASGLTCLRGGREVFANLEFMLPAGEAMSVTGRNGAGKSSLLRIIAGLLPASNGRIALEGGDGELTLPEQCHYLGHRDALKPSLSVTENLDFWRAYLGGSHTSNGAENGTKNATRNVAKNGATADALAAVGLQAVARLPAAYLSAGQRRRLSLARLIAVKRTIWLLDEPTSSLDTAAQAMLTILMNEHLATGGLIVAATHSAIGLMRAQQLHLGGAR